MNKPTKVEMLSQSEEIDRLREENMTLRTTLEQVLVDAQSQDVLAEWWPMMERALNA